MNKLSYRVILHGPMSWKTSQHLPDSINGTPYLVIFEPVSSMVIVSQGTLLIPHIPVYMNKINSQILSVFVFNDASLAKQLVSELYNYSDKNINTFDIYKNEKVVSLLSKSLSSFHLPLEVVVKRVDYSSVNRQSTAVSNTFSNLNQRFGVDPTSNMNMRISNTVTNNILNYNFDSENKMYKDEPKSVKNSYDNLDSYNLRVGLEEGFYMVTTSTDLMKKLFQCLERKGPRVNRLSLNFYKIRKDDPRDKSNLHANTMANNVGLSTSKISLNRNNTSICYKNGLKNDVEFNKNIKIDAKNLGQVGHLSNDYKLSKNPGFYTPGFVSTPLFNNGNVYKNNTSNMSKTCDDAAKPCLSTILRSLTAAIDKNTEALNLNGSIKGSNKCSHNTDGDVDNVFKSVLKDTKQSVGQSFNGHGLVSMSTSEFFGYSSPTSNCNSNNLNMRNFSLLSDSSPDSQLGKLKTTDFTDLKLDDFHLKPFNESENSDLNQIIQSKTNDGEVKHVDTTTDQTNYDGFVQNYIHVLEKLNEVESLYDLDDIKKKFTEQQNKKKLESSYNLNLDNATSENVNVQEDSPNVKVSSRTEEKGDDASVYSDSLSNFTEDSADNLTHNEYPDIKSVKNLEFDNQNTNTNEKNTTFRDDEECKSDIDSNFDKLSTKSDLNVLMDEFNQLSTKNELLSRDNSKYRTKILRLKDKIKNIKSLHKYELEDVMNTNYSNEEKLRSAINDNNVTIKMMEQERLKLTEMVEQHKMIIKRLSREKLETVQQLTRLEEDYNKLQMVREMDKNEKYAYNKTKLELEQLKSDNEVLNNKLRTANEKILKMQHDDKVNNDIVSQLKEKLKRIEEDKVKTDQLLNENRVLKSKEVQMKDKFELMKRDHVNLRSEFNTEKSNNLRLIQHNEELKDELRRVKATLSEYESRDDKLESKLSMLESNNTVLLKNLEASKNEINNLKLLLDNANKDKLKVENKYLQLQSSVEKVEYMNNSLSTELVEAKKLVELKNNEGARLVSLVTEKENELVLWKNQANASKEAHAQLQREHSYLRASYEAVESSYRKFQQYEEGLRSQLQVKAEQNQELLRQLREFQVCMDTFKSDTDLKSSRQQELYSKLAARFFLLASKYDKLKKDNALNKIKLVMMEHKNNSMLIRRLIRTVLLSKAKIAKRNCQILSIVGALQMKGPTTCSMIISRINTLVAVTAESNSKSQDKIAQLKTSFMKHSLEKDQMIKVLQTKLVSMDQLKENQQFLLEENRNLSDQIMAEQNNSQKLQQALNEQIERERFAFESESKSLYSRQYQLLRHNEQLSKENHSLKESLNTLLQSSKVDVEPDFSFNPGHDPNPSIFDVKYERVKSIYDSVPYDSSKQPHYVNYFNSPTVLRRKSELEEVLSSKTRDRYPRMVYHRV
ncbi:conserved hypothetical protein [Theileria orientalis strain Shintoku]|uniref:Uncharacterized protein n=1 Tax=Theileria orientalis strain Shintoku TaxID=869250 RepID=J4D8S3_THEOR|nr:conserved hypothetical protein [Theileria orientalis strain Shintoku]BAM40970.1 conserved hypothetical protein [Theileria orientalis strain Shintoku]|eukprot:XP_009691271.1 conserved hypothetical protein [Theileria orientalis strain Shintoku]